jgi:ribonuclease HI
MKEVRLFTDGSCLGNPGKGGWACILDCDGKRKEMFGSESHTTNNRMELTASVEGLAALKIRCKVDVVTDSEYVKNGITKWLAGWKRNGWMTSAKKPVANQDLWEALETQVARHETHWHWTKGHANHADNNRCDELAQMAARKQSKSA